MSQSAKDTKGDLVLTSPREYFVDRVEDAIKQVNFEPLPLSRQYLVDLLQHFMISTNLFPVDDETGKLRQQTLAEMYLRAQNSSPQMKTDLLKKLGDSSLYISGFFSDSLNRKVVDLDYYVDMGGVAYSTLASVASDEAMAQVYSEYATHFAGFVDVLNFISQDTLVKSDKDLLKLYSRYLATGSRWAEQQLLEKGLLNADLPKAKINKM